MRKLVSPEIAAHAAQLTRWGDLSDLAFDLGISRSTVKRSLDRYGFKGWSRSLKETRSREIRERFWNNGEAATLLAHEFGMTKSRIYQLVGSRRQPRLP